MQRFSHGPVHSDLAETITISEQITGQKLAAGCPKKQYSLTGEERRREMEHEHKMQRNAGLNRQIVVLGCRIAGGLGLERNSIKVPCSFEIGLELLAQLQSDLQMR